MLALPFLSEFSRFEGRILATDPTVEFGRLLMEDLVNTFAIDVETGCTRNPVMFNGQLHPMYSLHDIEECIRKIERVHYSELVELDAHGDNIRLRAISSGFCLGGSNWIVESPNGRASYVAASSNSQIGHSAVIDPRLFEPSDAMVITQAAVRDGSHANVGLAEMLKAVVSTLEQQGNVLFPVYPCGSLFELIAFVSEYLQGSGFVHTPMHVVSSVAKRCLAMANIEGEWMSEDKQSALYEARKPLKHGDLLENGLLYHHEHMETVLTNHKGPYVVFAGHPSLCAGDVMSFLDIWSEDARSMLVITERLTPHVSPAALQARMRMRVCVAPLEIRPSSEELVGRSMTDHALIALRAGAEAGLVVGTGTGAPSASLKPGESITIPFKKDFVRGLLMEESVLKVMDNKTRVFKAEVSVDPKRRCTIQTAVTPFTKPLQNRVAATTLASRCAELGSPRIQEISLGVAVDWDNDSHRVVFADREIRIESLNVVTLGVLRLAVARLIAESDTPSA
ncbi:Integrator complex subunit 9 [Thoreauomyces humboldtii]|nr:Integrator complex subunit 9 [Thoreauomyces humboldtii]